MRWAVLLGLCFTCLAVGSVSSQSKGIKEVEHVVIFMQENRAFDHYYGHLQGVRGFNDRAAPKLPSGRSPFYQPVAPAPNPRDAMCGCASCASWKDGNSELKAFLTSTPCVRLAYQLKSANPPVTVKELEKCSDFIDALRKVSYDHMPISDVLDAPTQCKHERVHGLLSSEAGDDMYMLPYPLMFNTTSASCMPAPEMDYPCDIAMWNNGSMNAWNTARQPGFGMSYFNRSDLPFYYALADAFTVGDQYFQSTFTATNPNRLHLFTGSNGLSVKGSGENVLTDAEPADGFKWETMGEILEKANVTWKVYQEKDNFDDNAFAWFANYINSKPGDPIFDKGMATVPDLVGAFEQDVKADKLPSVSILIAPTRLSEHATNHPADGEDLTARFMKVLSDPANKKVYSKMAFILNYDEGGQFFDHHWTPTPPCNDNDGASTVTTEGEVTLGGKFLTPAGQPIGLGFRVPLMIISPWTRGNYVFSQVSDHTSVVKFIEERFGVRCPNISPWRRAVTSDLVAAFDFDRPDLSWPPLPDTSGNVNASKKQCEENPMPVIPIRQSMPVQEKGVRKARPLPYDFNITDAVHSSTAGAATVAVTMHNVGAAAAVFLVYNYGDRGSPPRKFTVEGGKSLTAEWRVPAPYSLSLHGPNGFVRQFSGSGGIDGLSAHLRHNPSAGSVEVALSSASRCLAQVQDNAYGLGGPWTVTPQAPLSVPVSPSANWYDLTATLECEGAVTVVRRFMGHMEDGTVTTSDPAMGRGGDDEEATDHPDLPLYLRTVPRFNSATMCSTRRAKYKDACADAWHEWVTADAAYGPASAQATREG